MSKILEILWMNLSYKTSINEISFCPKTRLISIVSKPIKVVVVVVVIVVVVFTKKRYVGQKNLWSKIIHVKKTFSQTVLDVSWNLPLKLHPNRVSNSWDIADFEFIVHSIRQPHIYSEVLLRGVAVWTV